MASDGELVGFWLARRFARPWKPGPRKHPKMPRGPWWTASAVCFLLGLALGLAIFGQDGTGVVRGVACGVGAWVIGMIIVETIWERRSVPPTGPSPS